MIKLPNTYFVYRSVSVLFDEVWLIAIPLFVASKYGVAELGKISSVTALGDFLGLLFFPWFASKIKSSILSIFADLLQIFCMVIVFLMYRYFVLDIFSLSVLSFFSAFSFAIWFGASDTLFTILIDKNSIQSTQKKVAISQNFGPVVGPAIGSILFGFLGIGGLALLNAFSFFGQMLIFIKLSLYEKISPKPKKMFESIAYGINQVSKSNILSNTLIFPIFAKIFIFGFLPFFAFSLKKQGLDASSVGLYLSPYGIGILLGAFIYRGVNIKSLPMMFTIFSNAMILVSFVLIFMVIKGIQPAILSFISFILGGLVSFYQIKFRSLRQLNTDSSNAASVITVQGIVARAATPFSGFLFSFILSSSFGTIYLMCISLAVLSLTLWFSYRMVSYDNKGI